MNAQEEDKDDKDEGGQFVGLSAG